MLSCAIGFDNALLLEEKILLEAGNTRSNLIEESWDSLQSFLGRSTGSSEGEEEVDTDDSALRTALSMNLTKKEAQSRLSAEDFKLWKKAQRSMRNKRNDDD